MAEKRNTNPFAEAERTLVEEIRAIPEVSGLFGDVETQVFGACDEDFAAKIEALIATGIGTGIVVAFTGTAGTPSRFFGRADGASPRLADTARIRVEVKTRLLDADRSTSATDVATAIVRALDRAEFDAPSKVSDSAAVAPSEEPARTTSTASESETEPTTTFSPTYSFAARAGTAATPSAAAASRNAGTPATELKKLKERLRDFMAKIFPS